MAESDRKKRKLEPDPIFATFLKDEHRFPRLKRAVDVIKIGGDETRMIFMKIAECNARESVTFAKASCSLEYHLHPGYVSAGIFFIPAVNILEEYSSKESSIPRDKNQRDALAKLLKYLSDDHGALLYKESKKQENQRDGNTWAIILAQHLLMKLAVHKEYQINNPDPNMGFEEFCPCEAKDRFIGNMGDTSFGCAEAWHGKADLMMMGSELTVQVQKEEEEDSDYSMYSYEIQKGTDTNEEEMQLTAQTIVYSFLKRNCNTGILNNYLVPGLVIGRNHFKLVLYDSENDVLVSSLNQVRMFDDIHKDIQYAVTVILWMTINYRYLCSGVPKDSVKYSIDDIKAEFFKRVGSYYLQVYQQNVIMSEYPKARKASQPSGDPWTMSELLKPGTRSDLEFVKLQKTIQRSDSEG